MLGLRISFPLQLYITVQPGVRSANNKKKQERDNLRAANFQAAMNQNVGNPTNANDDTQEDGNDNEDVHEDETDVATGEGDPSHEEAVTVDNVATVGPSQEQTVATVDEDNDDYAEYSALCYLDVKGVTRNNAKWKIENVIVPEVKTEVVKYVMNHEDMDSFLEEDFELYEMKGLNLTPV